MPKIDPVELIAGIVGLLLVGGSFFYLMYGILFQGG